MQWNELHNMRCYATMVEQISEYKTFIDGGINERPHLIYDSTTKKLELDTAGYNDKLSITVPSSFNGKRIVFWLSKKGIGRFIVKASISNYASTLTRFSNYAARITIDSKYSHMTL